MSYGSCTRFTECMAKKTNHRERPLTASSQRVEGWFAGKRKSSMELAEKTTTTINETTCSATERIWNCKVLPVFILLPGLQLVVRDRFALWPSEESRVFHSDRRLVAVTRTTATIYALLLGQAHHTWKQATNGTIENVFLPFNKLLQTIFFPVDTRKRECLDNLLSLKNPDVAEPWILAYTIYH